MIEPGRSMAGVAILVLGLGGAPPALAAQSDSLPPGVTPEMVAEGATLFGGTGLCLACHGPDAKGLTAPDLTDDEWLHNDGSFEAIVQQILTGVPLAESKSGIPMLPRAGSQLTDDQVRAVAAYVWTLGRD